MDDKRIPRNLEAHLRGLKIIVAALVMSSITFGAITLVISKGGGRETGAMIAYLGLSFAAIAFVAGEIMSRVIVSVGRKELAQKEQDNPEEGLLNIYRSRLIIRGALLQGAVFFNLVAFMASGIWWSFAIAAVFTAINLSTIPSRDRLLSWIDQQVELLALEQSNS